MQTNVLPRYDDGINTTGCCPKFNPKGWDAQTLHFENKSFARATTKSVMHIPLNMGRVFDRVQGHIEDTGAYDPDNFIVLSRDLSSWQAEHLFASDMPVPDEEMVELNGNFLTKVFEGPYQKVKDWHVEMQTLVRQRKGTPGDIYFFYTTCPKCAKAYGKNYIVAVAKTD